MRFPHDLKKKSNFKRRTLVLNKIMDEILEKTKIELGERDIWFDEKHLNSEV